MWTSFFFQAEDGIRDLTVTGVQTCALPISRWRSAGSGRYPSTASMAACWCRERAGKSGHAAEVRPQFAAHRPRGVPRRRDSFSSPGLFESPSNLSVEIRPHTSQCSDNAARCSNTRANRTISMQNFGPFRTGANQEKWFGNEPSTTSNIRVVYQRWAVNGQEVLACPKLQYSIGIFYRMLDAPEE